MSLEMSKLVRALTLSLSVPVVLLPESASAAPSCSVSASAMSFGIYDPLSVVPNDSTTVVSINCAVTAPNDSGRVNYALSASAGAGSFADRRLVSGPSSLSYNLYVDAAISPASVWGDGTAGTRTFSGTLGTLGRNNPSAAVSFTIYGRIPARQDVPVGFYSSSVIVTVDY